MATFKGTKVLSRRWHTLVLGIAGWVALGLSSCVRSGALPPPASISSLPPMPPVAAQPPPSTTTALAPAPETANPLLALPNRNPWQPGAKERDWKFIVLHHTASDKGDVDAIDRQHRQKKDKAGNPWLGIGYHFVIGNGHGMADGAIEPTFRWRQQLHGAHAGSSDPDHNQVGIGIVLVGDFEKHAPTSAQLASVKRLVGSLKKSYSISSENVIGHRDVRATECPGRLFPLSEVARSDRSFGFSESAPAARPPVRVASQERVLR